MRSLLLALLFLPAVSWGQPSYEAGVGIAIFSEDGGTEAAYRLRAGWGDVYGWAGYDAPEARVLGQPLADLDVWSVGFGVGKAWGKGSAFFEAGYAFIDADVSARVQNEIAYTHLVGRHAVQGRAVPVQQCYRGCFESDYTLDDAPMVRLGLGYQVADHVKATLSYRWLRPEQYVAIWDAESRANGGGWWEETTDRNLSAVEFMIMLTY